MTQRKKPKIGDRRITKKYGLQIRVMQKNNGMLVTSGSRYLYEWRKPASLMGTQWESLLNDAEKSAVKLIQFARTHEQEIEESVFFGDAA